VDYVKFIYRPLTARAARQVLVGRNRDRRSPDRGRFTRTDVAGLLEAAWLRYAREAGKLSAEPTVGSRMNVRLACFTMSFFNALLAIDTDRDYAIELVADAAWRVYRLWSTIALGLAFLTPGKTTSLAFAVGSRDNQQGNVSLRFPFNAPGYLIEPVAVRNGTSFDVVRCPIADYFRGQGAVDLCSASWCNLDYALAELTREKLVRTKTLVRGDDRCDFRLK
jgi:ubiquinone biosynthesis protein